MWTESSVYIFCQSKIHISNVFFKEYLDGFYEKCPVNFSRYLDGNRIRKLHDNPFETLEGVTLL